jgi:hypothetical protein
VDLSLTEEHKSFQSTARQFLDREVVPYEGTSQIQKLLIERAETGISTFV